MAALTTACPAIAQPNEWVWMRGGTTNPFPAVYGTMGVASPANTPGQREGAATWTDRSGNLWLFSGMPNTFAYTGFYVNDLWEYNPATNEWVWEGGTNAAQAMPGSNATCSPGFYGSQGVPAATNIPGGRYNAATWTDLNGDFWLFGGGGCDSSGAGGPLNDLWRYQVSTGQWTWMGGSNLANQPGVYGILGVPSSNNVPGARESAAAWVSANGSFWLFGGLGTFPYTGEANDLWEYNLQSQQWTWHGGNPGGMEYSGVYGSLGVASPENLPGERWGAVTWSDATGNLWLFGGQGYDSVGNQGLLNDLWEFSTSSLEWTWVSGSNWVGLNTNASDHGRPGVYGQQGLASKTIVPGGRLYAVGWTDSNGVFWLFGGSGIDSVSDYGYLNDLWAFNPATREWAWMGGPDVMPFFGLGYGASGVYGTATVPSPTNYPGGRYQASGWFAGGNFWLFAGFDIGSGDDLWELIQPGFVWPAAPPVFNLPPGTYNSPQVAALTDLTPGATIYYTLDGSLPTNASAQYTSPIAISSTETIRAIATAPGLAPSTSVSASYTLQAAQPRSNPPAGQYTGGLSVTLTDTTPGASIYFTTDGSEPTTGSTLYTSPLTVSSTTTIKAIATAVGYAPSLLGTATYSIGQITPGVWTWVSGSSTVGNLNCNGAFCGVAGVYGILGVPSAGNAPGGRNGAVGWVGAGGTFWLFGGIGFDSQGHNIYLNDLWQFNSLTQEWAWMSGSQTATGVLGVPGIYGQLRAPSAANTPGARTGASAWTDAGGNLWLFGGSGLDSSGYFGCLYDMWMYSTSTGKWTWEGGGSSTAGDDLSIPTSFPGVYGTLGVPAALNMPGARVSATSWTDLSGNFWLFGGAGFDASGNGGLLNDLWMFSPSMGLWTWMSGSSTLGQPAAYTDQGLASTTAFPAGRSTASGWTDDTGNLWLFGGAHDTYGRFNDLWEFLPRTGEWVWAEGGAPQCPPTCSGSPGVYGSLGIPAPGNLPGGRQSSSNWSDTYGNLWLFGGYASDSAGNSVWMNDLWEYSTYSREWSWMGGSSTVQNFPTTIGTPGVYGAVGVPAPANVPGGRLNATTWSGQDGKLWLFGGDGVDSVGATGYLNDLWVYQPSPAPLPPPIVPNVVGMSQALATSAMQSAGLTVGTVGVQSSDSTPIGNVISESPSAGAIVSFGSSVNLTISSGPVPQSVALTPTNPSLVIGMTLPFKATAIYPDSSTSDVTLLVTWTSATTSVATISTAGSALGVKSGTSSISASLDGVQGSTLLTVTPLGHCDVNQDGKYTVADAQSVISETLGVLPAVDDLNGDHAVNVVDIQIVLNSVLNLGCTL